MEEKVFAQEEVDIPNFQKESFQIKGLSNMKYTQVFGELCDTESCFIFMGDFLLLV
jgi:hypothetical protein